jgi:hypothetical protein
MVTLGQLLPPRQSTDPRHGIGNSFNELRSTNERGQTMMAQMNCVKLSISSRVPGEWLAMIGAPTKYGIDTMLVSLVSVICV